MLDALITSKTRIRLLVKFFLNPTMKAYLRQLADEFGESTNAVRVELNRLTEAGSGGIALGSRWWILLICGIFVVRVLLISWQTWKAGIWPSFL